MASFPIDEAPYPVSVVSSTGLKRTNAFGVGLTLNSSDASSMPSRIAVAPARWPPAEPPDATIFSASIPNSLA